jgi:hypothetical protein
MIDQMQEARNLFHLAVILIVEAAWLAFVTWLVVQGILLWAAWATN